MNSLLNAFNKLDVELRLNLLLKYFQETNSDPQLAISNVDLSAQADGRNGKFRHFATVTKRNTNLAIFGEIKQEVELNLIIENLLLNYSSELLEKYSSGYSMDIKLINKKLDNIVSVKTEIEEFKNRFNKDDFKKSNDLIKDAKKGIINQLSTLNFKKVILSSDELLDDFDNYSLFLEDDHLKYVRQLIQLIDKWSSEGYVYYSLPNDSYNGMFFTFNEEYIPRLQEVNAKRGGVNESLTKVNLYYTDGGWIGHYQAPTSTVSRQHPNFYDHKEHGGLDSSNLWHNGILKEYQIKHLQEKFNTEEEWDTALLHKYIMQFGDLNDIDGSFAVLVEYKFSNQNYLYFARNALVPLYMNSEKNILSSVKVPDLGVTELIEAGHWYYYCDDENKFIRVDGIVEENILNEFTTKNNPYDI